MLGNGSLYGNSLDNSLVFEIEKELLESNVRKMEGKIRDMELELKDKINRIGQLRQGVLKAIECPKNSPDVIKKYTIADMITGFGVAEAVRHYYDIYGGNVKGKKAIVQGFGKVGSAAAFYLADMGVQIVGIIVKEGGLIHLTHYIDSASEYYQLDLHFPYISSWCEAILGLSYYSADYWFKS